MPQPQGMYVGRGSAPQAQRAAQQHTCWEEGCGVHACGASQLKGWRETHVCGWGLHVGVAALRR